MKKITIREVAKAAGVSASTVSQALNGYTDISEPTRERVLRIAQELGYVPNSAARSLASKTNTTIALILNEINVTRGVAMPLEILNGVVARLDESEYEFVFYATSLKKQREKTLQQFADEHSLAGIIIQGLNVSDPYYQELEQLNFPVVAIDLAVKNSQVGTVSVDNERASFEVTERLQKAGYQRILFVNGSKDSSVSVAREAGYRRAMGDGSAVVYADFSEDVAYRLSIDYSDFDAVFAASDLMAIGVQKRLKSLGMARRIALVGFDDITLASYVTPTLTTVRQDIQRIARQATSNLIENIEKGRVQQTFVPHKIIVRESAKI